jgi:hypothetical protein
MAQIGQRSLTAGAFGQLNNGSLIAPGLSGESVRIRRIEKAG